MRTGFKARRETPAILTVAGDVADRRILDASCGSSPLFATLRDRGAIVTGLPDGLADRPSFLCFLHAG